MVFGRRATAANRWDARPIKTQPDELQKIAKFREVHALLGGDMDDITPAASAAGPGFAPDAYDE
jgi:hypothetical protein